MRRGPSSPSAFSALSTGLVVDPAPLCAIAQASPRSSLDRLWCWALVVFIAGPLLLLLLPHRSSPDDPLPPFLLEVTPDHSCGQLGPQTPTLSPSSLLTVVLRPKTAVRGPVRVDAFLDLKGSLRPLPLRFAGSRWGTQRLRLPLAEIPGLPTGVKEIALAFALSRSDGLVSQVLQTHLHIQGAPE